MQYIIPEENLERLQAKIDFINRKAAKLKCGLVTLTMLDTMQETDEYGEVQVYQNIDIVGDTVKIDGWAIVARIDHEESGNIINVVPDTEVSLIQWKDARPYCEQCKEHRNRLKTYILLHTDGAQKQVGHTCLKDFLGYSAESAASYAELLLSLRDDMKEYQECSGVRTQIDTRIFLQWVACIVRREGWISASKVRDEPWKYNQSTKDRIFEIFDDLKHNPHKITFRPEQIDIEKANSAIEWIKNLVINFDTDKNSEYMHNLKTLCTGDSFKINFAGYVASLIVAYDKAVEKEYEKKNRQVSQYIGEVTEKVTVTVTVYMVRGNETHWGYSTLYMSRDDKGNIVKWFTTSGTSFNERDTIKIVGTVKALEEWNGIQSTLLTRVKLYVEKPVKKSKKTA